MTRPVWFVDMLKRLFAGRYWMAKATRIPPIGKVVDALFFAKDDVIYLPKNQVIHIHREIAPSEDMVLPSQVVEHFVEQSTHRWLMNHCICRDAAGCKDYPIELGCLFLGEATLDINPKLGRFVSKEEALDHLRRCREAGLVHMVGRNKLDTFWMGVRPGSKLMTICNCCPCCCLFGVLPHLSPDISRKVTKMPGVSVTVNENCVGCGLCVDSGCFVDAIWMEDGRAHINGECRGCGHCVTICPHDAIDLQVTDARFVENTIKRLSRAVDVS
jgi:ferredoxin